MIWLPSGFLRAAVPHAEPQVEQPADDWCPRCRIHRVRQDTYSGAPVYVALCPVCADDTAPKVPNHTTQTRESA